MSLVKAVVNQVLLWGAWGAAESFGIRMLLQAAYGLPGPFRLHRPPPKSAAAITHWHVARLVVVLLYLAYCVVRSYTGLPPSLYAVLGLSPSATEHEIKQKYRYFARIYHPDKAGFEHEGLFLRLQHAYTVLSDPLLRYAYDRYVSHSHLKVWRRSRFVAQTQHHARVSYSRREDDICSSVPISGHAGTCMAHWARKKPCGWCWYLRTSLSNPVGPPTSGMHLCTSDPIDCFGSTALVGPYFLRVDDIRHHCHDQPKLCCSASYIGAKHIKPVTAVGRWPHRIFPVWQLGQASTIHVS